MLKYTFIYFHKLHANFERILKQFWCQYFEEFLEGIGIITIIHNKVNLNFAKYHL